MPALQVVCVPKGLQRIKMEGVEEMHTTASCGNMLGCFGCHHRLLFHCALLSGSNRWE